MLSTDINNPQPQTHDFIGSITNWWKTCPLFTRCILFFSSFIMLLALFSHIDAYLVNIPSKTIGGFQITRLIFCPFTFESIAELLFGLIAYLPMCAEQEKHWGTLKTATDFFIKNLEINLLFLIICYILSIISDYFLTLSSYGLWGIFFANLLEKSLENTEGVTLFLGMPFQIATKFYPVALFILFTIITEALRMDIIAAALVGILHFKFLNVHYFEFLNDRKMSSWEASSFVTWLRTLPHYVGLGNMPGALIHSYDHPNPTQNIDTSQGFGSNQGFGNGQGYGGNNQGFGGVNLYSETRKEGGQDVEDLANDMEKP